MEEVEEAECLENPEIDLNTPAEQSKKKKKKKKKTVANNKGICVC